MSTITGNESAQPHFEYNEGGYGNSVVLNFPDGSKQILNYQPGLTIRQHFAGMAMQGILANPSFDFNEEWASGEAVKQADTLIAELNKQVS